MNRLVQLVQTICDEDRPCIICTFPVSKISRSEIGEFRERNGGRVAAMMAEASETSIELLNYNVGVLGHGNMYSS